jgi:hypothetical protein
VGGAGHGPPGDARRHPRPGEDGGVRGRVTLPRR